MSKVGVMGNLAGAIAAQLQTKQSWAKPQVNERGVANWRKPYGIAIVFTSRQGRRMYYRWYKNAERRAVAAKILGDRYASDKHFSVLSIRKGATS